MSEIGIEYYGHSCFQISFQGKSCIFDPYAKGSVPGLRLKEGLQADTVYCSHDHSDHNAADLVHEIPHEEDPFAASFITVPHDEAGGTLRGMSDITCIHAGGCKIAHFGDIGRLCTEDEYELLKGTDIILIPCGGHYTIDAQQARQIMERLQPSLTILMHFRDGSVGYDVLADISQIKNVFPELKETGKSVISFDENQIPEGIITLKPLQ